MTPAEFYLPLKHIHLSLVFLSLGLFVLRGSARLFIEQYPLWASLNRGFTDIKIARIAPHIIDTFLLLSGVLLTLTIQQYPGSHAWLSVKMLLLVAYILLGIKAMRSQQVMQQRLYFALAITCITLLITVAKTHHPLGLFSLL